MLKKMVLYSPAISNDGGYIDAGTTVEIGTDDGQVNPDRAQSMLDMVQAVSLTDAKADESAGQSAIDPPVEDTK